MGEYARYAGKKVKIGTCESMYYLRADQARQVVSLPGNVDPVKDAPEIRFRFPFPDEDGTPPGAFEDFNRGLGIDVPVELDVDHGTIQFRHEVDRGYRGCFLASLPCPHSKAASVLQASHGIKIHANLSPGSPVEIVQQRCIDGIDGVRLLVARCTACGALWRVGTLTEALPYVEACLKNAQKEIEREMRECNRDADRSPNVDAGGFWRTVAARIVMGYERGGKTVEGARLLEKIAPMTSGRLAAEV